MRNMFKPSDAFFQRTFIKMYKNTDNGSAFDIYFHWKPKNGKFVIRTQKKDKYTTFQKFHIPSIRMFTENTHLKPEHIYILSEINPFDFEPDIFANIKSVMNDFTLYIMPNFKKIVSHKSYSENALINYIEDELKTISSRSSHKINVEVKNDIMHVFMDDYIVDKPKFQEEKKTPKRKTKKKESLHDRLRRIQRADADDNRQDVDDNIVQIPIDMVNRDRANIDRGGVVRTDRYTDRNGDTYFEDVHADGYIRRYRRRRTFINGREDFIDVPVEDDDIDVPVEDDDIDGSGGDIDFNEAGYVGDRWWDEDPYEGDDEYVV